MSGGLFRPEALAGRRHRLAGDIVIAVPVSWQIIGYLLLASLATAVVFMSVASFARVEVVTGVLAPDAGVATILPTRDGVITSLDVRDGQEVTAGTRLAAIRSEEDAADLSTTGERVEAAIKQQDASLIAQIEAYAASASAEQRRLAAQRSGLEGETAQLASQISIQNQLIATAEADLARMRAVHEKGFISGRDLQGREDLLLTRRQQLAQLTQALASRRSALTETRRASEQSRAQANVQLATLSAVRAEVAQSAASASGARSYVLRAPVGGRVTALVGRVGQVADPSTPLMSVVPRGSVLRADLSVGSAAIGFIKPGQDVRLAIDAFPYQRYGTIPGTVLTVASSAVSQPGPDGAPVMVYPVTVELQQADVFVYGTREPLIPGMTLTARIVTEKQSLLQWLFEPLFAIRRR